MRCRPSNGFFNTDGDDYQNEGAKTPDGVEDAAQIIAAGGGERIDGVAEVSEQVVSLHAMLEFGVADGSLHGVTAFLLAAHGWREASLLAGDDDTGFAFVVVAAIAAVDIDALGFAAAGSDRLRDRGLQGMAVIGRFLRTLWQPGENPRGWWRRCRFWRRTHSGRRLYSG